MENRKQDIEQQKQEKQTLIESNTNQIGTLESTKSEREMVHSRIETVLNEINQVR